MSKTANALEVIQTLTPQIVFQKGGVEDIISKLERDVRAMPVDPTTEKGRKEIKSIAHKVARTKTGLDGMGKDVQAEAKAVVDRVNEDRRVIRVRLDALRDEVRAPVDEYEAREKERVEAHQSAIREIEYLASYDAEPNEELVRQRLDALAAFSGRDWQEFAARGAQAYGDAERNLNAHAVAAKARREAKEDADRIAAIEAEKRRVRQEEERKAREEEIARQAAETARIEAERRAKIEQDRVERERQAAIEQARRAEQQKIEAAKLAEEQRKAAEKKAEEDKQAAIIAERKRVEDEKRREQQEAERRANDRAHKAKVNGDALRALIALGLSDDQGKAVITAIVQGKVPNVILSY